MKMIDPSQFTHGKQLIVNFETLQRCHNKLVFFHLNSPKCVLEAHQKCWIVS